MSGLRLVQLPLAPLALLPRSMTDVRVGRARSARAAKLSGTVGDGDSARLRFFVLIKSQADF